MKLSAAVILATATAASAFTPQAAKKATTVAFMEKGAGGMFDTRNPEAMQHEDPRKSISAAPSFEEYLKQRDGGGAAAAPAPAAAAPAPVAAAPAPAYSPPAWGAPAAAAPASDEPINWGAAYPAAGAAPAAPAAAAPAPVAAPPAPAAPAAPAAPSQAANFVPSNDGGFQYGVYDDKLFDNEAKKDVYNAWDPNSPRSTLNFNPFETYDGNSPDASGIYPGEMRYKDPMRGDVSFQQMMDERAEAEERAANPKPGDAPGCPGCKN